MIYNIIKHARNSLGLHLLKFVFLFVKSSAMDANRMRNNEHEV